jgi:sec-independent protein translocase protein TatC
MTEQEKKKSPKDKEDSPGAEMTFIEHLEELRRRILVSLATLAVCFAEIYILRLDKTLVKYFKMPMDQAIAGKGHFQFLSPTEGFVFDLKISLLASVFAASPMIFYQFWKFIAPALYKKEKKYVLPFILSSTFLFVGGAAFGYFVIFPFAFRYFAQFTFLGTEINPRLSDYFTFATRVLLAFGLVFEFPLVAVFLGRIGLIGPGFFNRNRKYAIIVIFIAAAMLTPGPDPLSQILLAVPLWFLYELSALLVWILRPKNQDEELAG